MKRFEKYIFTVFAAVFVLILSSCGGGGGSGNPYPVLTPYQVGIEFVSPNMYANLNSTSIAEKNMWEAQLITKLNNPELFPANSYIDTRFNFSNSYEDKYFGRFYFQKNSNELRFISPNVEDPYKALYLGSVKLEAQSWTSFTPMVGFSYHWENITVAEFNNTKRDFYPGNWYCVSLALYNSFSDESVVVFTYNYWEAPSSNSFTYED